jgi:HAD superfamily hydrolase (TIGR01509 family)
MMLKALIFDVDGTLADTESAHRAAFNATFAEVGLDWHWSESLYAGLLDVAGGKERILYYWNMVDPVEARGRQVRATVERIHAIKTRHYEALLAAGGPPLRPGVLRLVREAHAAGLALAIATTTTPANVDALLAPALGSNWRTLFASVCDGVRVPNKKPAPDVYLAALRELGLGGADCVAFEDSENGLRAATAAGIATVITPTAFTRGHSFAGALRVLPHLGETTLPLHDVDANAGLVNLAALRRWHGGATLVAA